MNVKFAALLAVAAGSFPLTMSAATITPGSFFNLSGTLTVSNANPSNPTITFSNLAVQNQGMISDPVGGTFLTANGGGSVAGQTVTMQPLNASAEPINTLFSDPNWLMFPASDNLPSLTLTFIPQGVDTLAGCAATPPAAGQTCTPPIGNTANLGPFSLQNLSATTSSAGFDFIGVTADGVDSFQGIFTAQFTVPFQTVLATLAASGSVSDSFSGTVSFAAVPEPGSFVLLGVGILLLIAAARIHRRVV